MTKLLDEAIAQARTLPEDKQDQVAEALFAHIAGDERRYRLTPEQVEEVKQIQRGLRTGATRLLSDEEMDAFWKILRLMRARYSPRARAHLTAIFTYIAERNPRAATHVLARIRSAVEQSWSTKSIPIRI